MAMNQLSRLETFVSRLDLAQLERAGPDARAPSAFTAQGAVLFTDFAGFTPLAEQLAREGPVGAEKLSEILDWYFGILVAAIAAGGGDIVTFAGDALVALFAGDGQDVTASTRRAVRAAQEMQRALAAGHPPHAAALTLRATVGSGAFTVSRVGGVDGRWLTLLGGTALDDVFDADRLATPGRVTATAAAWRVVSDGGRGELLDGGRAAVVHELGSSGDGGGTPKIPAAAPFGKGAEALVLPVVRERLAAARAEFLAEFREASVVFVRLPGVDPGHAGDLARLHAAAVAAGEESQRLDGTLYQMLLDDKGCSLVLAFGLPGHSHDDDPARAADAAVAVCARLRAAGIGGEAGVATGTVFCGAYGSDLRRNYGIMGPTMNRAARLMQAADGRIIVDETTRARGARWLGFDDLPPVRVKGIAEPLRVFAPRGRDAARSAARPAAAGTLIGRVAESERIAARLDGLRERGEGGAFLVEAEAGMGKSTLLSRVVELARARDLRVLDGAGDSIERSTAFLGLQPVIRGVLGVAPGASVDEARRSAGARLALLPERTAELAPLLNAVLPLDLPDNALTSQMTGTIRAANLTDLLIALVEGAAAEGALLLALEDLHWMDDASLQFCGRMLDAIPGILIVATLRPMSPEPASVQHLAAGPGREKLTLETLAPDELVELVRRRLGAATVPVAVKELILAKAEGNPFYSEEIALALRESGAIVVEDGECRIAAAGGLSALDLPGTVKGVITSRVDRLEPGAQLALKVASVLGRSFERSTLEAVHPDGVAPAALDASLAGLQSAELLTTESGSASRYAFRHALIHETTYNLLPFAQRRALHAAAAEHLETANAADLTPHSGRLAYHWSHAERPEKAVRYLGDAGRQALEAYANQSAVDFFSEALKLDSQLRGQLAADKQRASWHRQLAEGHYSLIQWDEAREHYEQAIRLSGFRAPRFGAATPLEVIKHMAGRYAPRLVFGDPARRAPAERDSGIEALRACDNLQVVYLWQGNRLSLAHTVFEGANIAHRIGPSAESAFARAMLGYLLVMAGMRKIAERDLRAAVDMAERSGQLLQRVSCNMYLGMTLSLLGRPVEGIPYLETADELVSQLGAGLWKHRGKYMLAEPHLMVGNLDRAAELFGGCATIAMSVEPPITGFANAMRALCWVRQGRVAEAIALIQGPTGIRLVRDNPIGLQLYNSLGALIEGYLWTGQWREALEAGREGVAIPERGDDANSFFTGYNAHSAVARLFLTLIEQRRGETGAWRELPEEAELWELARRARRNFKKGAKLFPGAQAPYLLIDGLYHHLQGRDSAARDAWRRARSVAEEASMPYESAMAMYELGRHSADAAERERLLGEAGETFARFGMPRYAERCDAARKPAANRARSA